MKWTAGYGDRGIPLPSIVVVTAVALAALAGLNLLAQSPSATTPLPAMAVPADNPQTDAKISLGRQLYFDGRLSANDKISCATCHDPQTGWAGHTATDTGIKDVSATATQERS